MVLALPRVTNPANELVPEPVNAPALPTPVPLIVTASAPTATPLISSVAPELTVVPVPVVPNASIFDALNVPALTVVNVV